MNFRRVVEDRSMTVLQTIADFQRRSHNSHKVPFLVGGANEVIHGFLKMILFFEKQSLNLNDVNISGGPRSTLSRGGFHGEWER
jgi:hypothetical protein